MILESDTFPPDQLLKRAIETYANYGWFFYRRLRNFPEDSRPHKSRANRIFRRCVGVSRCAFARSDAKLLIDRPRFSWLASTQWSLKYFVGCEAEPQDSYNNRSIGFTRLNGSTGAPFVNEHFYERFRPQAQPLLFVRLVDMKLYWPRIHTVVSAGHYEIAVTYARYRAVKRPYSRLWSARRLYLAGWNGGWMDGHFQEKR